MDNRSEIRDFLATRRARLTPEAVGLPAGTRRRVPGLRREEVAVLAGVSTEWYTRLEKGHIAGVSEDVLDAVARALRLDDDERAHLLALARAARPASRRRSRPREAALPAPVHWMLDSVTGSAAFVRDGRLDVVASNALGRALHAPMFQSPTTAEHGVANFARYHFLDEGSRDFFPDWRAGAAATVALLRAEAGREPQDRALRELIGELTTCSADFADLWASHDVRTRHEGSKRLAHPVVGEITVAYQSVTLSAPRGGWHDLSFYTAEPGTRDAEQMALLASWTAPQPTPTSPSDTATITTDIDTTGVTPHADR